MIRQPKKLVKMKTKLSKIAEIKSGHPFRGKITPYSDGEINVVQVRDTLQTGEVLTNGLIKTRITGRKSPDWLQQGDILLVAKGMKHYAAIVENIPLNTVCSPHFFLVKVKPEMTDEILPEFICWQLNQLTIQQHFNKSAEGTHQLSIRKLIVEQTPMVIIPLEKQQQIVNFHRCAIREKKLALQLIENTQQQEAALDKSLQDLLLK